MAPTPVLLPGKPQGWRSLVGCSPWGHKESDVTERLHFQAALRMQRGDFPGGAVAKTACSQEGLGSILGQRTRSHVLQIKITCATAKTWQSQINKYFKTTTRKNEKGTMTTHGTKNSKMIKRERCK